MTAVETLTTLDIVRAELTAADAARPRSQQRESGASQVLSCRAAMLLRSTGAEPSDVRLNLDPLTGTAIHSMLENAADFDDMVERRVIYRGTPCTVDRYFPNRCVSVDWKTKADAGKVADIARYGPDTAHIWQVMLGAAGLIADGYPVETVELLYIPRAGGTLDDCYLWSAPFSQGIADEAADWMQAERQRADALDRAATADDLTGLRDKDFWWCAAYCEFFTLCRTPHTEPSDEDYAEAASRYHAAHLAEKSAKADKREAAGQLSGFVGRTGGFRVGKVAGSSSYVLDTDAVEARSAEWQLLFGEDLPTRLTQRSGYTTVNKVKP